MPKIDIESLSVSKGSGYPGELAEAFKERTRKRLGNAAGLTQFGVNLLTLQPGVASTLRHWHTHEDEFVYVLSGEVVLVTDEGEQVLRAGQAAGFPAGVADGHCLQNRSGAAATLLEVGSRNDLDGGEYPDHDLRALPGRYSAPGVYVRKNGEPY